MLLTLVLYGLCVCFTFGINIDLIEKDLNWPIEKLLLEGNHLFVATLNTLHRLSLLTLNSTHSSFNILRMPCSSSNICLSPMNDDYHWKILSVINGTNLLVCGTNRHGSCQIIDHDFNLVLNSSVPVVANDRINSTIGLILPESNLVYFGVTYTNQGKYRWQIPNISGRSLDPSRFMKILAANEEQDEDQTIYRDELSLRFMPRQQATFIVQYVYAFKTLHYVYFLVNQPNELEQPTIITKIIRFCRKTSAALIRSYSEIPLICSSAEWIIKDAQLISDSNSEYVLVGLFVKRDDTSGSNFCKWKVTEDIDRAFQDNYRRCYSTGVGQRGLAFIKPNEPCRRDENWSLGLRNHEQNICPWIISDRLPYPLGATNPLLGHSIYMDMHESSSTLKLFSFNNNSSIVLFQGLINGTFKLGIYDFLAKINWLYSNRLSTAAPIHRDVFFNEESASFFIASQSKIHRLSFAKDCASRVSCAACLSSSTNPFCGWCAINDKCTLSKDCSSTFWQQNSNQCTSIISVHPRNASLDRSQWINITLSNLSPLGQEEIYQCFYDGHTISVHTQAIKLAQNHLSCPTPTTVLAKNAIGSPVNVILSVIKWPSNKHLATIKDFVLYNCSVHVSCQTCTNEYGCQWCSNRCSSFCIDPLTSCPSFELTNSSSKIFIQSDYSSIRIPVSLKGIHRNSSLQCTLNDSIIGQVDKNSICNFHASFNFTMNKNMSISLKIYENDILIGLPKTVSIYWCEALDSCDSCYKSLVCSWCQGKCIPKRFNSCSIVDQCISVRIQDFFPKRIPIGGGTELSIFMSEPIREDIHQISIADLPCLSVKVSDHIRCFSSQSNYSRKGHIKIQFHSSIIIMSDNVVEYLKPSLDHFNMNRFYEFGGQSLILTGSNLQIGNDQMVFLNDRRCVQMTTIEDHLLSCRLPAISSGLYNVTLRFDRDTIIHSNTLINVTPNPIVRDIHPTTSFASGGRLVTVRGMYLNSAESVFVEFSYKRWNAKFQVFPQNIVSSEDGIMSSFQFRTPSILPLLEDSNTILPLDVHLSLYFDNSIYLQDIIQFSFVRDVLLNISSALPILSYTGEELKIRIENLTEAASVDDIELFIGCSACYLKTFNNKGITCQPPTQLVINTFGLVNNQNHSVDCSLQNDSVGPIRFRIGFREYLIGYLSYSRSNPSRFTMTKIIYFSISSCAFTFILLTGSIYLYIKIRSSKGKPTTMSPRQDIDNTENLFWSTTTSATAVTTAADYQVYEPVQSISSSNHNTSTRSPLLFCPYHCQQYARHAYSTMSPKPALSTHLPRLFTISVTHTQLKNLYFESTISLDAMANCQAMELFFDLLNLSPFRNVFLDQLLESNCEKLIISYLYLFRYDWQHLQYFCSTNTISFFTFISTLYLRSDVDLIRHFDPFDRLIHSIIDFLDSSPSDQVLHRSFNSLSANTILSVANLNYKQLNLPIIYENSLRIELDVFDCDTIEQVKQKLAHHLNSIEYQSQLVSDTNLDVMIIPLPNLCPVSRQLPMMKDYSINSFFVHFQNSKNTSSNALYNSHLIQEHQLITDESFIEEHIRKNKFRFQPILNQFFHELSSGLELFSLWKQIYLQQSSPLRFHQEYIRVVSELLRRIHQLVVTRSDRFLIQSMLHVIADGLEFMVDIEKEFPAMIRSLFEADKNSVSSLDGNLLQISMSEAIPSQFRTNTRSKILPDDRAIECLFQLYQFYESRSEKINQQIGQNHVGTLLPIHHLLVQIRQLINSNRTNTRNL